MSNAIKGTTRVSNNDKKLMKDLWVAGKDNPVEKNRQKRKLTQTEKATRQSMPEERAELAFKNLRKKQKITCAHIEVQPCDDLLAIECVQNNGWSDFCDRQTVLCKDVDQMKQFEAILKSRKKKKGKEPSNELYNVISRLLPTETVFGLQKGKQSSNFDIPDSFRFLGDVKNKRFQNFRAKANANRTKITQIVTDVALSKQRDHFFSHEFCNSAIRPLFSFIFTNNEQNSIQLESAEDFCDNIVNRLERCRLGGIKMDIINDQQCSRPHDTNEKAAAVELTINNDYEFTRQPRIMIRCDSCCKLLPLDQAIPKCNRLFFHAECYAASQKDQTVCELKFNIFSTTQN